MEHVNKAAFLTAIAIAMMALTGTAAADKVTSSEGETPTIKATYEKTLVTLVGANGIVIECESSAEGTVQSHGVGVSVSGAVTGLSFHNCNNGAFVVVNQVGSLIGHATGVGGNALLTSTGAKVTATVKIFGTEVACVYTTNNTPLGVLTGSFTTGGKATADIEGVIPRTAGSNLCGVNGELTAKYLVNSPATLDFDPT